MSDSTSSGAAGGDTLLLILFIALKLTHVINWSWWWVLAPLWGGFALLILIGAVAGIWFFTRAALRGAPSFGGFMGKDVDD